MIESYEYVLIIVSILFIIIHLDHQLSCGLLSDDSTPRCWGWDEYDQVSDTPADTALESIAMTQYFSCGLRSDKLISCWGGNNWNPL